MSVEDVQAYLNLSKDRVGLVSEQDQLEVFKELTKCYEPLALGNVNRVYKETRSMAKEVLSLHMNPKNDVDKIDHIIKSLTEEYTHDFIVTRDVAEKIGLKVVRPNKQEEDLIMKLYQSYETELKMNTPLDAEALLALRQSQGSQTNQNKFKVKLGSIESMDESYSWVSEGTLVPPQTVPQMGQISLMPTLNFKVGKWMKHDEIKDEQFD